MKPITLTPNESLEVARRVFNHKAISLLHYMGNHPIATPAGLTNITSMNFAKCIRTHINPYIKELGLELEYNYIKGRSIWAFRRLFRVNIEGFNWHVCVNPRIPENCRWVA